MPPSTISLKKIRIVISLLDVPKIIIHSDQITNNIRHYTREIYKGLSEELIIMLRQINLINPDQSKARYLTNNILNLYKEINIKKILKYANYYIKRI
jgi:hypothetical protein